MCPDITDPGQLLALACYAWPDADDVAGRDVARLEAVLEMRALARGWQP